MKKYYKKRIGKVIKIADDDTGSDITNKVYQSFKATVEGSYRLINPRIKVGYDADDFVRNLFSVVCTWDAVKIPRFLKNYFLNKKQQS